MQVFSLPWRDPGLLLARWGDAPWFACLDSLGPVSDRARWIVLCRNPVATLEAWGNRCTITSAAGVETRSATSLDALRDRMAALFGSARQDVPSGIPFAGGVVGFAGYGLGMALEHVASRHEAPETPDLACGFYDHAVLFDRMERRVILATLRDGEAAAFLAETVRSEWPDDETPIPDHALSYAEPTEFAPDRDAACYRHAVQQAVALIAAGDVFQVNITGRMRAARPAGLDALALYQRLRAHSPAPFGAFLAFGSSGPDGSPLHLLSSSPERFCAVTADGLIQTRPIKGTAPRGATEVQDQELISLLKENPKERAENLMIVDLMRNDLGRVAALGSVQVPVLFEVEKFEHVSHLVSEVQARFAPGRSAIDLLKAALPPGSVTGAPKHRAMEIIDALEASARGPYCGTVFRLGVDGAMDSSVIIRTLVLTKDHITAAAGGGITILSDPEKEYDEMRLKIAPLLAVCGAAP